MVDIDDLKGAIINGDQELAREITGQALEEGLSPATILDEGLIAGMEVVGKNEIYVPEVLIAARAMKTAMELLAPKLIEAGVEPVGTIIIGTVQGDQHDIGKNLVAMMLKGAGFKVIDLGIDVSPEKFIEASLANHAELVGLSALLTTTMVKMEETLSAFERAGVGAKVMVGGAPVTQEYADKIGASGYAADAATAVEVAKQLIGV